MRIIINILIFLIVFSVITLLITGLLQPYIFFSYFIGIPAGLMGAVIILLVLNFKLTKSKKEGGINERRRQG